MRNGALAGFRIPDGSLYGQGVSAGLWSSSDDRCSAGKRTLYYNLATEYRDTYHKSFGFSAIYKIKGGIKC